MKAILCGSAIFALFSAVPAYAAFDVPDNDGFVTDEAGILQPDQEAQLEQTLDAYDRETSNQIAVLILKNSSGAVLSDLGVEIMRKWGIGQAGKDNGILLLMSYEDRQFWMTTGYGLEGAVPDIVAKGIYEKDMQPEFRDGNYYDGLAAGIDALKKHIGGEYTADRYSPVAIAFPWLLFAFFVFLNWVGAILARSKSWWLGGIFGGVFGLILFIAYNWWWSIGVLIVIGLLFDYYVSKAGYNPIRRGGRFGSGGWGGGGSSGGFRGFGGGSSGGGGAGGSW